MTHLTEKFHKRAEWLGYMGLIPFVIGMILMIVVDDTQRVAEAIHNYAAIILTFVGAIHWGRALENGNDTLMSFSVIPSLIAWGSLFLAPYEGLLVVTVAFITQLFMERDLYTQIAWFKRLRTRLSVVVSTSLIVSWLNV
jgi:hypothetical protein